MMLGLAVAAVAAARTSPVLPRHAVVVSSSRAVAPRMQTDQKEETGGGFSLPFLQPNVPVDQQPVMELKNLKSQAFYDWADDDDKYKEKLISLYQGIMLFASLPISYTTFYNLPGELPNLLVAANLGTVCIMVPFIARLRVGWGFVSQRLREKSTYYEANQRGFLARKGKADMMRDRLVFEQEVGPIIQRIDRSLIAIVLALILSFASTEVVVALQGENGPATLKTLSGDEARRFDNRLRGDNEFAAEQQRRAQNRNPDDMKPAYCDSRYYKILAGGNGQGGVGCGGQN